MHLVVMNMVILPSIVFTVPCILWVCVYLVSVIQYAGKLMDW